MPRSLIGISSLASSKNFSLDEAGVLGVTVELASEPWVGGHSSWLRCQHKRILSSKKTYIYGDMISADVIDELVNDAFIENPISMLLRLTPLILKDRGSMVMGEEYGELDVMWPGASFRYIDTDGMMHGSGTFLGVFSKKLRERVSVEQVRNRDFDNQVSKMVWHDRNYKFEAQRSALSDLIECFCCADPLNPEEKIEWRHFLKRTRCLPWTLKQQG